MVDLPLVLDDAELRRQFGTVTVERAEEYLSAGHVIAVRHEIDEDGDLDIRGAVLGSRSEPYQCFVAVGLGARHLWVHSRCTCPVLHMCKHAAALMLAVRAEQERTSYGPGNRRWERELTSVLDELDDSDRTAEGSSLALQFELARPAPGRYRAWVDTLPGRGTLRIRPMQRGARDNWVKSGVSWQNVPHLPVQRRHPPEQAVALAELLASYRVSQHQGYYGSESHLPLGGFGPSLWRLLERAAEAGIAFVPGSGIAQVTVRDAVSLEVDVNAASGSELRLRLGVRTDEEWYGAGDLDLLGDNGHGVALWSPARSTGAGTALDLVLAPLTRPVGPHLRRMLAAGAELPVPASEVEDLVTDYLPRLQRHVPVVSSDASVVVPDPAVPELTLTVTYVAIDQVGIAWSWRYESATGERIYALDETRGLRGFRRPDLERQQLDALVLDDDAVYRLCDAHHREHGLLAERTFTGYQAVAFVEDVLPGLEKQAAEGRLRIVEAGVRPDYRAAKDAPVVHFAARDEDDDPERTDWLDLEVLISVDGDTLALPALLAALTRGEERVVLRRGVHVAVDRPEFAQLAELVEAAGELIEQPRDGVRVGHHDLGLWDELAEIGLVDAQASQWVEAAQALRGLSTLPDPEPEGLQAELRPYQRDGFRWLAFLWQARLGGILADDMGLGKTLQTLALVAHARARGAAPFLVVAPTSVVSTWAHEAAHFTPGLVVRTISESQSRRGSSIAAEYDGADLLITSYTLFRLEADAYVAEEWGGLVLDEAQMVKNHQGKTYQAVRRLDVPFRLALTGTPMENRLMELWSLLSIVAPGLYPWPQRFVELVANPVERLGDAEVLDRFRRRIRPFLLRRTKELVAADLPAKQEQVLEVRLAPRHRRIYETHLQRERQTVLGLVDDFERHRIAIFRSLTRLRQLSLDPALVDSQYDGVGSAKVDLLVDHLAELAAEGHRALVFSQFTSFLRRVRARLDREGIGTSYLDGSTTRRGEVIEEFKAGTAPVFLISLKAGGVGLTLTEADYVFVLDPWWNPAVEAQAVDRTHRIGQTKPVMVYRLVSERTIEEKVMELKARKAALFARVVDGGAGGSPDAITAEDVRALFGD
jgi:superfamily II DNA or RNA helicase